MGGFEDQRRKETGCSSCVQPQGRVCEMHGSLSVLAAMWIGCTWVAIAEADDILALAWSGRVCTIDSKTGLETWLGESGFTDLNSLAQDNNGRYFSLERDSDAIIEIDPDTGRGSIAIRISETRNLSGFAYGNDLFYGVDYTDWGMLSELYTIDPSNGDVTKLGIMNHWCYSVQGLAFGPDGVLYGWDVFEGLLAIDPSTGIGVRVGKEGTVEIQTLEFDKYGRLWGCGDHLFSIDPSSGEWHLVSGSYPNLRGMAFTDTNVDDDCLTLTVDQLFAGKDATWTVSGAVPSRTVLLVYGHRPGRTVLNGLAKYCADFGIKGVNQSRVLCRKRADYMGRIVCKKWIPEGMSGLRVLTQATQRGTCPTPCMSNVDDQIVE